MPQGEQNKSPDQEHEHEHEHDEQQPRPSRPPGDQSSPFIKASGADAGATPSRLAFSPVPPQRSQQELRQRVRPVSGSTVSFGPPGLSAANPFLTSQRSASFSDSSNAKEGKATPSHSSAFSFWRPHALLRRKDTSQGDFKDVLSTPRPRNREYRAAAVAALRGLVYLLFGTLLLLIPTIYAVIANPGFRRNIIAFIFDPTVQASLQNEEDKKQWYIATSIARYSVPVVFEYIVASLLFLCIRVFGLLDFDLEYVSSRAQKYKYYVALLVAFACGQIIVFRFFPKDDPGRQKENDTVRYVQLAATTLLAFVALHKVLFFLLAVYYFKTTYKDQERQKVKALTIFYIIDHTNLENLAANDLASTEDHVSPFGQTSAQGSAKKPAKPQIAKLDFKENLQRSLPPPQHSSSFSYSSSGKRRTSVYSNAGAWDQRYSRAAAEERARRIYKRLILARKFFDQAVALEAKKSKEPGTEEKSEERPEHVRRPSDGFVFDDSETVGLEHVTLFFEPAWRALQVLEFFEVDGPRSRVRLTQIEDTVRAAYRQMRDLERSRYAMDIVFRSIDRSLLPVTLAAAVIVFLISMHVEVMTVTSFSACMAAIAFFCGNSIRDMFESLVFIFVYQPYSIGDRVSVDGVSNSAGERSSTSTNVATSTMHVKNIFLLSTEFETHDGQIVYVPNAMLAKLAIRNFQRAEKMSDNFETWIQYDYKNSQLQLLEALLNKAVSSMPQDYEPKVHFFVGGIAYANRVLLNITLHHKRNWQDIIRYQQRRTWFLLAMRDAMQEAKINYCLPTAKHLHVLTQGEEMAETIVKSTTVSALAAGLRNLEGKN